MPTIIDYKVLNKNIDFQVGFCGIEDWYMSIIWVTEVFKHFLSVELFFFYQHYVRNFIYRPDKNRVPLVDLRVKSLEAYILSFSGVTFVSHGTSLWDLSSQWNLVWETTFNLNSLLKKILVTSTQQWTCNYRWKWRKIGQRKCAYMQPWPLNMAGVYMYAYGPIYFIVIRQRTFLRTIYWQVSFRRGHKKWHFQNPATWFSSFPFKF